MNVNETKNKKVSFFSKLIFRDIEYQKDETKSLSKSSVGVHEISKVVHGFGGFVKVILLLFLVVEKKIAKDTAARQICSIECTMTPFLKKKTA